MKLFLNPLISCKLFSIWYPLSLSNNSHSYGLSMVLLRSVSRSWCSGRLRFSDALGDSKERPSTDDSSTNSSLILKSPFSPVLQSRK